MKVVLIQNIAGIGKIDDIKDVSEGYARNFLFARNLAVPVTPKALVDIKNRQNRKVKDHEAELRGQQIVADKLEGYELALKEKVSKGEALYAAVGPQKVAEALARSGFQISKDQILLKPIKETGEYKAKIKFAHGLEAKIAVIVSKL
jgi:large subunit ribosomal protein L9